MPPQRVTSGWTRSTWPRSISSRKPQRVASCSPAAIAEVDGIRELGVGLELVGLERLLEPVDAELLELARDADRRRRVGAIAEPGVDQDRRRPSPAASRAAAASATSWSGSWPSGPQPSLTAVKPCSREGRDRARDLVGRVGHQRRGVGADAVALRRADQLAHRLAERLALDVPERDVDAADRVNARSHDVR